MQVSGFATPLTDGQTEDARAHIDGVLDKCIQECRSQIGDTQPLDAMDLTGTGLANAATRLGAVAMERFGAGGMLPDIAVLNATRALGLAAGRIIAMIPVTAVRERLVMEMVDAITDGVAIQSQRRAR